MAGPRRDTRGIVDASELFARVRFRRREPAEPLRPYLEHYWLVDWDLSEPYVTHVVPHPSVNLVFQRLDGPGGGNGRGGPGAAGDAGGHGTCGHGTDGHRACGSQAADSAGGDGELAGIGLGLFTRKLEGVGRACGAQFRPGGFRPFAPGRPVSAWTGRQLPHTDAFPGTGAAPAGVLGPADDDARVAALDSFLLALAPEPDPQAELATALVHRIRTDRTIRRVADFARAEGLTVRSLQRLFAAYVGVGPKWVLLRYRIHEALERAATEAEVDWALLAAELGYSDQAHLVRDFTATVGVPPTAYGR